MNKKIFFILFVLFTLCKCSNPAVKEQEELLVFDFAQALKNERKEVMISEIADSVEYLVLHTPRGVIVSRIRKIIFFEDYLYVWASRSRHQLFLFSKTGQFISTIGSQGRGPGEYIIVSDFVIDEKRREVVVSSTSNLIHYSLEGKYLYNSLRDCQTKKIAFSDTLLWCTTYLTIFEKNAAIAISPQEDTIVVIPNPLFGKESFNGHWQYTIGKGQNVFYNYSDNLFYTDGDNLNDTIYKVKGSNLEPYAYLDMGRYKLPMEYRIEISNEMYQRHGENFYYADAIGEDHKNIYFTVSKHKHKAQNLFLVFDKKTGSGFSFESGFADDVHKGPYFILRDVSDDYYIGWIEAEDIIDMEYNETILSPQYKHFLSTINEETNELIILCRKKQGY